MNIIQTNLNHKWSLENSLYPIFASSSVSKFFEKNLKSQNWKTDLAE